MPGLHRQIGGTGNELKREKRYQKKHQENKQRL
jgi:hypothetical protein